MLVLSRRVDESIVIGHNITVTILSVRSGHVSLGVQAPTDVEVNRQEIEDAKHAGEQPCPEN